MHARTLRRRRHPLGIERKGVGARFLDRREILRAATRARLAQRLIIRRGLVDQLGALGPVADQRRSHADRAAGVEHMDHRPRISRRDPQRGVRAAGGRAADQQRAGHLGPLHLARDGDHFIERGRDQPRQADEVGLMLLGRREDVGPRRHDAQVDDLIAVALQHDADDVLADVVDVALDRGHDDLALAGQFPLDLVGFDERQQVRHRALHHAGRLDHLRQEHAARSEQVADHVHAVHQRPFDHLDRADDALAGFLGILDDERVDALDQGVGEPLGDRPAAPFERLLLGHRIGAAKLLGERDQPFGGVASVGRAVEHDILARFAQLGVDRVVNVQLAGVDDRHVHARRGWRASGTRCASPGAPARCRGTRSSGSTDRPRYGLRGSARGFRACASMKSSA